VFERVVCGIDGSPESLEALRQVERLRPETGELHLVAVAELRRAAARRKRPHRSLENP
jgi:hypothetical protein